MSRLRPAHGVALLFLANGLTLPSLWPRFPEIRDAVGATDATFGLALLGTGVGGVLGSLLAPRITRRIGTDRAAVVFAGLLAVVTVTVGFAGSVPVLFAALALMGVADGVADISQNALLFDVERAGDRSLASRMHAVWSTGALVGTGVGTVAATARLDVLTQVALLAVVGVGLAVTARTPVRSLAPQRRPGAEELPAATAGAPAAPATSAAPAAPATSVAAVPTPPADVTRGEAAGHTSRRSGGVWTLVAVAGLVVAAVESVANEWSALTLRDGLGATVTVAGLGPTAFAGAMLVGRLVGDRGIDRLGSRRVAQLGAGAVVVGSGIGLGLAAWLEVPALLVIGLVVAGVGAATLFPLMLAAGDGLDASGRGVAIASTSARAGFLVLPVLIGTLSDRFGPALAFAVLPAVGAVALLALPVALARGGRR